MTAFADIKMHCPPRCLRRAQAAVYVGMSPATFDRMVMSRELPEALHIGSIKVWDRLELDKWVDAQAGAVSDGLEGW